MPTNLKGSRKLVYINFCLLWLTIFNSIGKISTAECGSPSLSLKSHSEWESKFDQCLETNRNLSKIIVDLDNKLDEIKVKFKQTQEALLEQKLEYSEITKILAEQQVKLEQQHLQQNRKLLHLYELQIKKLDGLQDHMNNRETIIMRRMDGSVDFVRTWNEYKKGFGEPSGEFFIGLEQLYKLTNSAPYSLHIVLEDWDNQRRYAKYNNFVIGSEREQYMLHSLGTYTGTAGNDFYLNEGQKFTTIDRDNDQLGNNNCAILFLGAWWHKACYLCNLFGPYKKGRVDDSELGQIVQWHSFRGNVTSLKFAEMKIQLN
ncbi:fibrinogen C domain-containing protein 1-like [Stomoxys calcitrans]|uniref:Fibrinogen C-terminal domain-containing protein n=1 Tax=Stomoxys calcitrans TaxID=35570 RepID=A0A1I8NP74_STOCA|nr:fibrinogen C domain-containing protein 1 [Stomoxys calcitrans]XP_059225427.1 fibrinogen C domain-containing protein 1-like [Stomoxys calcitrans]